MQCKVLNKVCEKGTICQQKGYLFFLLKKVYILKKGIRGRTSGRRLPEQNVLEYPPPLGITTTCGLRVF